MEDPPAHIELVGLQSLAGHVGEEKISCPRGTPTTISRFLAQSLFTTLTAQFLLRTYLN